DGGGAGAEDPRRHAARHPVGAPREAGGRGGRGRVPGVRGGGVRDRAGAERVGRAHDGRVKGAPTRVQTVTTPSSAAASRMNVRVSARVTITGSLLVRRKRSW